MSAALGRPEQARTAAGGEGTPVSALLQVERLTRRFGGLVAVNAVSLDLRVGEVHAVIGTNGAGKSTLINMLSGEISASDGRISLDGEDITQRAQFRRAAAPGPLRALIRCRVRRRSDSARRLPV